MIKNRTPVESMTDRPFFSVITCTFNRIAMLERAMQSVLDQWEADWELIVVDDGSTDFTRLLQFDPKWKDHRIRFVTHSQNQGVAAARNSGIDHARGEYITFLDSDDMYLRHHLSSRKHFLQRNPHVEILHGGLRVIGDQYVVDKHNPFRMIRVDRCAVGGTFFIQRIVFETIGTFYDLSYGEDSEFLERAKAGQVNVERSNVRSYIYHRDHSDTLTKLHSTTRGFLPRLVTSVGNWKEVGVRKLLLVAESLRSTTCCGASDNF